MMIGAEEGFDQMPNWLTLNEAAGYLKLGKSTIYKMAREGDLPGHKAGKVWRFDAEELDSWLKSGGRASSSSPGTSRKTRAV